MYNFQCGRRHDRHGNADSRSYRNAHCNAHCDAYARSRLYGYYGPTCSARLCDDNAHSDSGSGNSDACRGICTI